MATAITPSTNLSKRKTHSLKIDMTPMVDLGFLLITFFIFTATLSQPSVTKLIMPAKGAASIIKESNAITLLLDKDKAFAYEGMWQEAFAKRAIGQTTYDLRTGIGERLREKQRKLPAKEDMMVIIKPLQTSSYQNVIAALDEMQINGVKRYAVVDATPEEESLPR